ncbi:AraC family transcriptional regulator [Paenibacillus baekrokdamisoli]|uniref:AraC family transcriptional regulator n=1 Tax=Paenibacillus baekrokdamisoli TaxID=1712516 RepID=A0A3G9J502_9BACL|nr:helix-turn-helix domain-containing protein [Paenibacillus baekrokdamisoli]MBB3069270.1 AraC-like DNA-binding protein [Paenibacillus baekrokdamisoli]BBH18758.1 AraC family transcriptional regulator [Paenibacillus baekrokdamisoli]
MNIEEVDLVPFIRSAGYAIRPPFLLGERNLLDYIIFYVQEGNFEIQVGGEWHLLKDGDLALLQPGDIHTIKGLTNTINPYVHLDFFYNPHRLNSFITLPGQVDMSTYQPLMQPRLGSFANFNLPVRLELSHPQKMRDLVLKMIDNWQLQTYIGKMEAHQLAHEWISNLIKHYMTPQTSLTHAKPFLNWITSYFAFHISEPISVEDMARRSGLSPSRFTVLFKQHFGITPHQYLLKLRLEHAQELLKAGQAIKLVSEYCGFTDVHHFSKTFKATFGLTPGQYRKIYNA